MKKIVFVTYGGGHVNMLIPVIKELQKNSDLELVVLGLTTAGSVLKKNDIPYIGFKNLLNNDYYTLEWGKKLVKKNNLHNLVSYEESVAYMGLSYVDLENEYDKKMAAKLYLEKGRQAFNPVNTMRRFLERESPDLLVATNSPRSERAAIRAAYKLGIPSVCLNDLFAIEEVEWLKDKNYATKICVLSEDVKSYIVANGRPEEDIVVTGNPSFDKLLRYKRKNDMDDSPVKTILWASQVEPEKHPFNTKIGDPKLPVIIEKKLVQIISNREDLKMIIRLHPGESRKVPDYLESSKIYISQPNDDLYEQISCADVVITMTSTVGFEAALIGRPLITIDKSIFSSDHCYSKLGISIGVVNLLELESAINKAVKFKNKLKNISKLGDSTSNVVSVINQYMDA